jgi:hypothetical protein
MKAMDLAKLMARVQRLLLSPAAEWDAIAGEPADVQAIYMNYVGPLVIAAALASVIGMSIVGIGGIRVGASYALTSLIVTVVLQLAMVYVVAFVINALAPQFGAQQDMGQAFKLAAYSPTASWIAGLLMIIPMLGILALLGSLYSLYLLYVGLPKLMKPPQDKALIYVLAIIGVMIVLYIVIGALAASMMPAVTPMMGR